MRLAAWAGSWAGALAATVLAGVGCSGGGDPAPSEAAATAEAATPFTWPEGPHPTATIVIAGMGEIVVELYPELAPKTVANFEKLAAEDFYAGTSFHRVIPGFMIQGGCPNTKDGSPHNDGRGGPGYMIEDEFNAAPHERGVLSMANTGRPNSGGSQFFIVLDTQSHLDGRHAVFGRVRSGLEVVDAIAAVDIDTHGRFGPKERPIEPVLVKRVVMGEATALASSG